MNSRTLDNIRSGAVRAVLAAAVMAAVVLAGMQYGSQAFAAEGPVEAVFGNVVNVTVPDSITVATSSEVLKLYFDEDSTLSGQGIETLDDVGQGDKIVATARRQDDGSLVADRVLVQPILSKPVTKHIFGVVVEANAGEVIVQDRDGNLVTIYVISGIELPEVGEAVTVVASLDRSTERLEARAFQRVADTVQRIEDAAESSEDSADKARLAEAANEARAKHLSVLEQTRVALERAREALAQADGDVARAEARLIEVQARYGRVKQQYDEWARANDSAAPSLRLNGVLTYRADQWSKDAGTFLVIPRGAKSDLGAAVEFQFSRDTRVIFTVIDGAGAVAVDSSATRPVGGDGVSAGFSYRQSQPAPLNEVRELIQSGTPVIVVYNPDERPPTAVEIIVLPPELDAQVSDAIEAERLFSFHGVITLVETEVDIDGAEGVVIVASDSHGQKVVAIVTPTTHIALDSAPATIHDLAAGHVASVVFEPVNSGDSGSIDALRNRFRAASIDARSGTGEDEVGIVGVIRELVPADRVIVVVTRSGAVKAVVPEASQILLNGAAARFEDLGVADLVLGGTRYNRTSSEITHLVAMSPRAQEIRGTIVGLAVDPSRVVVSTGASDVLNLVVNGETELLTESRRPLRFRDLAVGQLVVKGTYEITQRESAVYLVAKSLVITEPQVVVANGFVREIDAVTPLLHIVIARSTSGSTDSLALDVSERSVLYKNGLQINGFDSIEPGDIVESVAYSPSTNIIVKLSVSTPNLVQVRGTVGQVSSRLNSVVILTSEGRRVTLGVTATTRLSLNGGELVNVRGIEAGDGVSEARYIASSSDRAAGTAIYIAFTKRVVSVSPTSPNAPAAVETTVSGVIDGYEPGAWLSISGRRFVINSHTQLVGAIPAVGLVAKAALLLDEHGVFVATVVSVAASPNDDPATRPANVGTVPPGATGDSDTGAYFRVSGVIEAIGGGVMVIDHVRITINHETRIDGTVEVGRKVTAVLQRMTDGSIVAVEIVVEGESSTDPTKPEPTPTASPSPTLTPSPTASPEISPTPFLQVTPTAGPSTTPEADITPTPTPSTESTDPGAVQTLILQIDEVIGRFVRADRTIVYMDEEDAAGLAVGETVEMRAIPVTFESLVSIIGSDPLNSVLTNPLYVAAQGGGYILYVTE